MVNALSVIIVFIVLGTTLALFIWNRFRYDVVALMALFVVSVLGIITADEVFLGFANPAVITVVAILIINQGLINSNLVDLLAKWISKVGKNTIVQILTLTSTVAFLSAFMNNVGALALLMPVAIKIAEKNGKSPSVYLMPLAFGSLLGGWITLIGTPANLIISSFRERFSTGPFGMFDFSLVGLSTALICILFISIAGWRLLPQRKPTVAGGAFSQINDYLTEVRVREQSKLVGKRIYELESLNERDITVLSLLRDDQRFAVPSHLRVLQPNDLLLVKGTQEDLKALTDEAGLELLGKDKFKEVDLEGEDITTLEVVIAPNSMMHRRTVKSLDLRNKYRANLLAIAHQGRRTVMRLNEIHFKIGDVLLLQVPKDTKEDILSMLGCLPLAEREIKLGRPRQIVLALGIFGTALVVTTLNLLPVQISFSLAALGMVLVGIVPLEQAYKSVNWPVVFMLGAMIPVGLSLEKSGGAEFIASAMLGANISPLLALILIMVIAMVLSSMVNNVATVILMAPIAINIATSLGVAIDPFLVALVIAGSSAFLTPIGHQSNLLVMEPGGYKFGDYWRLGLCLQVIILIVSIPLILLVWPF